MSVKKLAKQAEKIMALADTYSAMSDEELKAQTDKFKERYANGEKLEKIMPEAFAVVREASTRTLGMTPYKEQIMAAIVLQGGNLAEQKTGEGKTLTVTMPVYLNALAGEGVHVITVNEYLAQRDAEWNGKLYEFLGMTVGVSLREQSPEQKRAAYGCDITYVTHAELGFDYLRDNMVLDAKDRVLRGLHVAFIDEADSVLIDEARTPLIISGGKKETARIYTDVNLFVKKLEDPVYEWDKLERKRVAVSGDYEVDEKTQQVNLTASGQKKAEEYFRIRNLYTRNTTQIVHSITQALKANYVMQRGKEYIVSDDKKVLIVDQSTGRVMPGRAYSEGLHQALEAKEGVPINEETSTLATITYQNLFRLYDKLAGMTGTAKTEEEEFLNTYNMKVIVIPTHAPVIREDKEDAVYCTKEAKYRAICKEVETIHKTGQPILLGTPSVEVSQVLSARLKKLKIEHVVLNAKNHAKEADIIAQAGQVGAVTVATNMAGRGTDIKLSPEARDLGGLAVIGAERHEARRIDNQLRGRSGRQGDPGFSRFYVSLEDELLVRFGSQSLRKYMDPSDEEKLESKALSKAITIAQKRIEGLNYDSRKQVLDYDDVLRRQREIIYAERNNILEDRDVHKMVHEIMNQTVDGAVAASTNSHHKIDYDTLSENLERFGLRQEELPDREGIDGKKPKKVALAVQEQLWNAYEKVSEKLGSSFQSYERNVVLRNIDKNWIEHIDRMTKLRGGIHLRSYAQDHPLQQYVDEGYHMFEEMNEKMYRDIAFYLINTTQLERIEG